MCKNWNGGQGEIYPFIPEIEEFAISFYLLLLLSFLFSRASTLPPSSPIRGVPSTMPRDQRSFIIKIARNTFLLFFSFLSFRMETRKKASMLIGRNNFLVLVDRKSAPSSTRDRFGWKMGLEQLLISHFIKASRSS